MLVFSVLLNFYLLNGSIYVPSSNLKVVELH